jgi:GT2 family glycosyltransferase
MSRVGIVTVTFNSASVLPDFFESVWRQSHSNFFLFVIDSASTDPTREQIAAQSDPRLRAVFCEKNIGFAAATNLGIRLALENGCEAILLLNNDTVFGPQLLQLLLEGLKTYRCDMTTPKMLYYDDPKIIWAAGGHLNPWLGYRNHHDGAGQPDDGRFDRPRRVTFTPFCCILMHRRVVDTLGFLDEKFFVYTEDADYCFRAIKARLALWYVPEAQLLHKVSSLTGGEVSDFTVRYCTRNRIYFLSKSLTRPIALGWYAAYWVYQTFRCLMRRDSPNVWRMKVRSMRDGLELFRKTNERHSST